ncbi:uncharacterized protein ACA1_372690 [Acanthamoeba castellanii str. Neff]|uniref:Uncharacterized protein n=1 Tax=Acanthamoeba castellanii (strain ATCC 30010 / Neff) TaxID=1257118 RepID=L8GHF2_ACACF|nr:uncharacterized protein ACA1_372690 [Acanthamoeba castellanii str. Neff]ELR12279.1 hypothetical protein ACA1_372690 [Acanthamoeba castellanii str. Neff]
MPTTAPCLFVPALLLLVVGSVSAETVTFCSGGCNTGRPQSCIPGVAHGKAQVDTCITQPGEYRGSSTPKAFQAYTVLAANLTQGNRSCQVLHMEFFYGDTCDQKQLVANTTPCYHDCSDQPLCCWAIFALEGSNSTIGAYFPTPASPSPSPSPSRRPDNDPALPEWAIAIIACSAVGAGLLILVAALVGVCLYRRRNRVSYDYLPSTNHY